MIPFLLAWSDDTSCSRRVPYDVAADLAGREMRAGGVQPLDPPFEKDRRVCPVGIKKGEFDAGRASVDDDDGIAFGHGSGHRFAGAGPAVLCDERRNSTGSQPGCDGVCPAGQDDRHARAKNDPGRVRIRQEGQALCEHVACF